MRKLFLKLRGKYLSYKLGVVLFKAFKVGVPVQQIIDELQLSDEEAEAVREFYINLANKNLI